MNTRYEHLKRTTHELKERTVRILDEGGADFAPIRAAVGERVSIDPRRLTLALAGEYSVGKSSLIKALTGIDVPVGAGVTTDAVREYAHGHIALVDMPGTLSGQMEHDEIAKGAITDSDLILFVVSNELFNQASLPYFKLAAEQLAKKHQMLLVVNKFDRFNLDGRTPSEAASFIRAVLADEIRPLDIDDYGPVVVSAKEYLSAVGASDADKRARRMESSRFASLRAAIDDLTERRGLLAQQLRPLQQLLELVAEATDVALRDDGSRARAEGLLRRRIFALSEARSVARTVLRRVRQDARFRMRRPAEKLLKLIDEKATPEEMEAAVAAIEGELQRLVVDVGDELKLAHQKLVGDLRLRIDEIDASSLGREVHAAFDPSFERPDFGDGSKTMTDKTRKAVVEGLKKGARVVAENAGPIAEGLATIYKFFGGRFRPWGKTKLLEVVGKAGKVLGPIVVLADVYLTYRAEQAKEDAEAQARDVRRELREQFQDLADQFDEALRDGEDTFVRLVYDVPLAEAQQLVSAIVENTEGRARLAQELTRIADEIRRVIEA